MGVTILLAGLGAPALAQQGGGRGGGGGGGGGGGSGSGSDSTYGDVFGDLVQIKRDAVSGVPILQKRWVAGKQDTYGWAYCPIGLNLDGSEVGFVVDSCDFDLTTGTPVPVDYFGRLSTGRTMERNFRMHFDEVIGKLKAAEAVWRDVTGRLNLGTGCTAVSATGATCATWTLVDSPTENISVYARLMKYGHIQTNPAEIDAWTKGDPTIGTVYHPALDPAVDYAKFVGETRALLPLECGPTCYDPLALEQNDLVISASLLATAADKTGQITLDLVQYMNRILKVPVATPYTKAPPVLLYPKIRDCGSDPANQLPTASCAIVDAGPTFPAPANEPFVTFASLTYSRVDHFNYLMTSLRPASSLGMGLDTGATVEALLGTAIGNVWVVDQNVMLMNWLVAANGTAGAAGSNVEGFVRIASDALRAVEFVHNYRVPELLWDFGAVAQ